MSFPRFLWEHQQETHRLLLQVWKQIRARVHGSAISRLSNFVLAKQTNKHPHSHSRKREKWKQRRTKLSLCRLNSLTYSMSCYSTLSLTHAHTASRCTLIQRLQLMLCIYNLPQTFLCSDMQIGELRGGKDSDNLTRVRQCSQSQLGGFKISSGVGWVGGVGV